MRLREVIHLAKTKYKVNDREPTCIWPGDSSFLLCLGALVLKVIAQAAIGGPKT